MRRTPGFSLSTGCGNLLAQLQHGGGQNRRLYHVDPFGKNLPVHKPSLLYPLISTFMTALSHSFAAIFQSVSAVFMPTIHRAYNNESKRLLTNYYYSRSCA